MNYSNCASRPLVASRKTQKIEKPAQTVRETASRYRLTVDIRGRVVVAPRRRSFLLPTI